MIKDRRCWKCNWLNKEVKENFTCSNCGESNVVKEMKAISEFEESIKNTSKKMKGGR